MEYFPQIHLVTQFPTPAIPDLVFRVYAKRRGGDALCRVRSDRRSDNNVCSSLEDDARSIEKGLRCPFHCKLTVSYKLIGLLSDKHTPNDMESLQSTLQFTEDDYVP